MMIIVWAILGYVGFNADRLRWKTFLVMPVIILPLTLAYDLLTADNARLMGGDESFRFHPLVIAVDVAITWFLWSLCYLIGYACGSRRRRRAADKGEKLRVDL